MIDLGWLGYIEFSWKFLMAVGSIVLIDLVLAGDNAVVIAMAVKNLPGRQRLWGIANMLSKLMDRYLGRCGGTGQGGRRDDDHRSVGDRTAEPAQVGRVRGDGILRCLRLRSEQVDRQPAQGVDNKTGHYCCGWHLMINPGSAGEDITKETAK